MAQEISLIQSFLYVAVLSGLAFALLTGVLYTLAVQLNHAIEVHDLVRNTHIMRAEFMASRQSKIDASTAQLVEDDQGNETLYVAQPLEPKRQAPRQKAA